MIFFRSLFYYFQAPAPVQVLHHMDNSEVLDGGDGVPLVFRPDLNEIFACRMFDKGMEGTSAPSAASFHLLGIALDSFNQGAASRAMLVLLLQLLVYVASWHFFFFFLNWQNLFIDERVKETPHSRKETSGITSK